MGRLCNSKFSNSHSKNKLLKQGTFILIIYFICHYTYKSKFLGLVNIDIINEIFYIFMLFPKPHVYFI